MKEVQKKIPGVIPLLVLISLFGFFILYLFPNYQERINELVLGLPLLDVRDSYDSAVVKELFTKLQLEGRNDYKEMLWQLDMIYPLVYAGMLSCAIVFFVRRSEQDTYRLIYLAVFPFVAALFDYLENFQLLSLLGKFPEITTEIVEQASFYSQTKWLLVKLSIAISIFMILRWFWVIVMKKRELTVVRDDK